MLEYLKTGKYAFNYDKGIKDTKREVAKTRKAAKEAKKLFKQSKIVKQVQFLAEERIQLQLHTLYHYHFCSSRTYSSEPAGTPTSDRGTAAAAARAGTPR